MKARITKTYKCAPKGAIVETFAIGDIVDGDVAKWSILDGSAQAINQPTETKVISPAETKAPVKRPRKAKK